MRGEPTDLMFTESIQSLVGLIRNNCVTLHAVNLGGSIYFNHIDLVRAMSTCTRLSTFALRYPYDEPPQFNDDERREWDDVILPLVINNPQMTTFRLYGGDFMSDHGLLQLLSIGTSILY
jgi:hypothetical protein